MQPTPIGVLPAPERRTVVIGCGCNKTAVQLYTWTGPGGQQVKGLTLVEAKARTNRKGGSYAAQ